MLVKQLSTESVLPQAMVVFASEQLWPNIQGLVHWHRHGGGLKDLCIYYTDDEHRSAGPARRFAKLAQKLVPPLNVHLPNVPGGKFPQDVFRQIEAWQKEIPGRYWIVNATGGLKLMFAGAIRAMELPNTEVVYGEISGEWYRWKKTEEGEILQPLSLDPCETDDIPVQYLVQAQSPLAADREWRRTIPRPLPIVELVKRGIETGWDWPESFRRAGFSENVQAGYLFERFVAAVLLELGIKQVDLNACLIEENQQSFQEIDVIANHRGRILIFDCKLSTEAEEGTRIAPMSAQIRQAAAICRDIGGIGARLLLLRPGRTFRPQEQLLAKALGLDVLDARTSLDFFRRIARFCGHSDDLPPALAEAQRLVDEARETGLLEAMGRSNFLRHTRGGEPRNPIIGLESHLRTFANELGQDWAIYKIANNYYLYFSLPPDLSQEDLQSRLEAWLNSVAKIKNLWISEQRHSGLACLEVHVGANVLKRFLASYCGRRVLSFPDLQDTDSPSLPKIPLRLAIPGQPTRGPLDKRRQTP